MDHEKKLEDYRRQYSGQLPAQAASNLQVIQSADVQRQSLADAMNRARERRILIERQIADLQSPEPEFRQAALGQGGDAALGRAVDRAEAESGPENAGRPQVPQDPATP